MELVFSGLTLFLVLLAPYGFLLHRRFLARLQVRHPATWERLGRPSAVYSGSIANGLALGRFIRRREYESLEDDELSSFCGYYRAYALAYAAMFVAMLLVFSIVMLREPRVVYRIYVPPGYELHGIEVRNPVPPPVRA